MRFLCQMTIDGPLPRTENLKQSSPHVSFWCCPVLLRSGKDLSQGQAFTGLIRTSFHWQILILTPRPSIRVSNSAPIVEELGSASRGTQKLLPENPVSVCWDAFLPHKLWILMGKDCVWFLLLSTEPRTEPGTEANTWWKNGISGTVRAPASCWDEPL